MKKILCAALAAILVLSLCACGGAGSISKKNGLHVGFGQADITPALGVALGGYSGAERVAKEVESELKVSCLAFQEGTEVLLLYSFDAVRSLQSWTDELRARVSLATGVKAENILVTATNTHAAPDLGNADANVASAYRDLYMAGATEAAQAAMADMGKATLYAGTVTTNKLNFTSHYLLNDGSYGGDDFGDFTIGIREYATENDPTMGLVKIDREKEDKADILLCNWQAQPDFTGGPSKLVISADFVGLVRDQVKTETGMEFFYLQGAAGNQSATSRIETENKEYAAYGKAVARCAIDGMEGLTPVEGTGIAVLSAEVECQVNTEGTDPETQAYAKEVVGLWETSGSQEIANVLAREYGLRSVQEASAILGRANRTQPSATVRVEVARVGGIGFAFAPFEMFAETGLYMKKRSEFGENTLIATQSGDSWGFVPSKHAYQYGSSEALNAMFMSGTAEDLANEYLALLAQVKTMGIAE